MNFKNGILAVSLLIISNTNMYAMQEKEKQDILRLTTGLAVASAIVGTDSHRIIYDIVEHIPLERLPMALAAGVTTGTLAFTYFFIFGSGGNRQNNHPA